MKTHCNSQSPARPRRLVHPVPLVKVWEDPDDRDYDRWLARREAEDQPAKPAEKPASEKIA